CSPRVVRRVVLVTGSFLVASCSLLLNDNFSGGSSSGSTTDAAGTSDGGSPSDTGGPAPDAEAPPEVEDAGRASGDVRLYFAKTTGELWTRTWTNSAATWQPPVMV